MGAPLLEVLARVGTPQGLRRIETEYFVERTARGIEEGRAVQVASLALQAEMAREQIEAWQDAAERGERTNELLADIARSTADTLEAVNYLTTSVDRGFDELSASIRQGFAAIAESLDRIAAQLEEQNRTLQQIAATLATPYETKARELRAEADRWLTRGMNNAGREQREDWNDSLRLFELTAENPIGNQDYVVWFHIGWLKWKHSEDLPKAETAFFRAQRLSAPQLDAWHIKSLRHLAYVLYLEGKWGEALEYALRVLPLRRDGETLYEAARYAAKAGKTQDSEQYLSESIDLDPIKSVSMMSEPDFQ